MQYIMSATTQKELDLPDAATSKTYRILTTAVDACTTADDVAGAERWMTALQVRDQICKFAPQK